MGVGFRLSSSNYDDSNRVGTTFSIDNYRVKEYHEKGRYLLVKIHYPDCKNYEGNKILLYKNCNIDQLLRQKSIDPHFSENKEFHSPIARFEPTDAGWKMGMMIIEFYDAGDRFL